jgi:N-methylhydantoinase A
VELGGWHDTPVFDRYRLMPGARLEGPAIIEERETTVVVGPAARVDVDEAFNLHMVRH